MVGLFYVEFQVYKLKVLATEFWSRRMGGSMDSPPSWLFG
jgi:hypothetical protein